MHGYLTELYRHSDGIKRIGGWVGKVDNFLKKGKSFYHYLLKG